MRLNSPFVDYIHIHLMGNWCCQECTLAFYVLYVRWDSLHFHWKTPNDNDILNVIISDQYISLKICIYYSYFYSLL